MVKMFFNHFLTQSGISFYQGSIHLPSQNEKQIQLTVMDFVTTEQTILYNQQVHLLYLLRTSDFL